MKSISLMPAWRRNMLSSVVIAVIVTSFTVASFSTCDQLQPHHIASVTLLSTLLSSFMIMQSKSNFEIWHVLCNGKC